MPGPLKDAGANFLPWQNVPRGGIGVKPFYRFYAQQRAGEPALSETLPARCRVGGDLEPRLSDPVGPHQSGVSR